MNLCCHGCHLRIVDAEHLLVGADFEVAVAVGEGGVVAHCSIEVALVQLRDKGVYVATALICRVADKRGVGRRHNNHRHQADMVRQTLVDLVVALYDLRSTTLIGANNPFVAVAVGAVVALQDKELLTVAHALQVGHRQRRLTHREVIYRIDDIGLAGAIVTHEAVEALVELQLLLCKILEVK